MKIENASSHRKLIRMPPKSRWSSFLTGIRPKLLAWYFLLAAGTTLVSLHATRQIFCNSVKVRSQESVNQQVEQFQLMAQKNRFKGNTAARTLPVLFDRLLSSYSPVPNEYILMFVGPDLYQSSVSLPKDLVDVPTLDRWKQKAQPQQGSLTTPTQQHLSYAVEPVALGGQTGHMVAIYNASAEFQAIDQSIDRITQIALITLGFGLVLAWITIGKILAPLKLLTHTAQSITESDMTRRIPMKGEDEIAELGTRFNEMLDRLQEAFDSQKEFLKDASHELRTPITVIQGHLETLQYAPPQQQSATLALVMDELDRMTRLVNDLLLLAKADHPHFLHLRSEELDWLTEELYLKARSMATRNWQLESKGLSPILVDRQRLTQAVMNLVQNAIRHTPESGFITLGSAVKQDYAYLWVRDTGEGIALEDRSRIFERFARATKHNATVEGHGLGLSIVQAIAQAHGGWIELSSRIGDGSTFTLVLPLTPPDTAYESDSHRRGQPPHLRLPGNRAPGARVQSDGGS
jgi:signal transduction histidine kinase